MDYLSGAYYSDVTNNAYDFSRNGPPSPQRAFFDVAGTTQAVLTYAPSGGSGGSDIPPSVIIAREFASTDVWYVGPTLGANGQGSYNQGSYKEIPLTPSHKVITAPFGSESDLKNDACNDPLNATPGAGATFEPPPSNYSAATMALYHFINPRKTVEYKDEYYDGDDYGHNGYSGQERRALKRGTGRINLTGDFAYNPTNGGGE